MTDKPKMTFEEWCATEPPPGSWTAPEPKPKVLVVEVPKRTFETAKAKPDKIRILTEDEHGNRVIGAAPIPRERPYRPRAEVPVPVDNGGRAAVGAIKWGRGPWPNGIPTPRWSAEPRGDELVRRNYDIFACLREDDDD